MNLTNSGPANAGVSTATQSSSCTQCWRGIAFGGGFYVQATFSFTGTPTDGGGTIQWPAFWMMTIEQLAPLSSDQWPDQASEYVNSNEFDVMEADVGATSYGATSHNWYGTNACDGSNGPGYCIVSSWHPRISYPAGTINSSHTYGFLWVPATGTSQGYVNYYFDGVLEATDNWEQFNRAVPPPVLGSTAFSQSDSQHYVLILGTSGSAFKMIVTDVQVWQASSAGNLMQ